MHNTYMKTFLYLQHGHKRQADKSNKIEQKENANIIRMGDWDVSKAK